VPQPLTTTSHALLGLLAVRQWSTYELSKQVQRGLGWFWPRTERKLYDEPKRLVADGLASATQEPTGRRPRTVYTITAAGRHQLRRWLSEPSSPPTLEFEAMVKVFFADAGTLDQLSRTLQQLDDQAGERLAELAAMVEASQAPTYEFAERLHINALSLRFAMDFQALLVEWARWAREQTESWNSTLDPGAWEPAPALEPPRIDH
jgi:PadR family transcriptional regulator, regulatory protein AphA